MVSPSNKINSAVLILIIGFLINACSKEGQAPQGTPSAMPPMPVSVISVHPTTVPISIESVAQTEGAKEVEIRPRVGGILIKKLFEEGEAIKQGQAMFLIDPIPYQIALSQAKAQLAQQKAQVEQSEREAKRLVSLLAMQSISQREADNAGSDYAMAKAALAQFEAKVREAELNLSYTTVTSPIAGVAGRFAFSEGALVSANTSLLTTVSQLSPIWVRFSISDSDLTTLGGRISEDNVKPIDLTLANGQIYAEKGKLNFAASTIDPQLGTQQMRATFNNQDKALMPGQFVRVRISTGNKDGVFTVPQLAVLSGDQGKFVFVVNTDKEVMIKPVVVGDWVGTDWVINSGLVDGDQVIVDNLIKVRPGAKVSPHPFGESPKPPTVPATH